MKIVFLDIDGVLNSWRWGDTRPKSPIEGQMVAWLRDAEQCLDPDAVERLNRIVDESGAVVVLTSTWRKDTPLPLMTRMLRHRGFRHRLFAATPHLVDELPSGTLVNRERGAEIREWMSMIDDAANVVERFVILDDDNDMTGLSAYHVHIDPRYGLTDADVSRALEILR